MHHDPIRRSLLWGLAATVLLPIVLAVVLGLGALLAALDDSAGAAACGRMGLVVGVMWLTAVVVTTAVNAVATLERHRPGRPRRSPADRGRRRPRRRRLRREPREPRGIGEAPPDRPA
jgi:hypothetical protein